MKTLTLIITAAWLMASPSPAAAQWTSDPYHGMANVCDAPGGQFFPQTHSLAGGNFEDALNLFDGLLTTVTNLTDSVFVLMDIENTLYDQLQSGGPGISSLGGSFSDHMNRMQALRQILEPPYNNLPGSESYLPSSVKLDGAHPNPFNSQTTINFEIPQTADIKLTIYDTAGRQVAELINEKREAGLHQVTFNSNDLASGIYFCRLQVENYVVTNKLILLK
jgi:hypothetical protein